MNSIKDDQIAVLLLAFGGPENLTSVEPFLRNVLSGRPITPELVERVRKRYKLIGGKSPLPQITRKQAKELERILGSRYKVYVGMRHWHPYIKDTVKQIKDDGLRKVIAIPMAPQSSKATTGGYIDALNNALTEVSDLAVKTVGSWHRNPLYIESVAETINKALDYFPEFRRLEVQVIFSAHSLPKKTVEGDPYELHIRETIEDVLQILEPLDCHLAYQSKGQAPGEWLGPDVETVIEVLAKEDRKDILIVPIGFICDHLETLYDIDIVFRNKAEELGMMFKRAASLNDSPLFIEALADIVKKHL